MKDYFLTLIYRWSNSKNNGFFNSSNSNVCPHVGTNQKVSVYDVCALFLNCPLASFLATLIFYPPPARAVCDRDYGLRIRVC